MSEQSISHVKRMKHQGGSVLLLCIGAVVLMATLATYFITAVDLQREASKNIGMSHIVQMGQSTALSEVMQKILDEVASGKASSYQRSWRYDYHSVNVDGEPRYGWEGSWKLAGSAKLPRPGLVNDHRINLDHKDGIDHIFNGLDDGNNYMQDRGTLALGIPIPQGASHYKTKQSFNTFVRWNDLQFFNKNLREVPEADDPVYVLRYAALVYDNEGLMPINHNFPSLDPSDPFKGPPAYNPSIPDDEDYLHFQSYVNRYARALKSMVGGELVKIGNRSQSINAQNQYREGYDEYDLETLWVDASGKLMDASFKSDARRDTHLRTTIDSVFRGSGMARWSGSTDANYMTYNSGGPRTTPWDVNTAVRNESNYGQDRNEALHLTPYGRGMRDDSWLGAEKGVNQIDSTKGAARNPNCPWRINVLTGSGNAVYAMLYGMSSHLRHGETSTVPNADLFGLNYPEAFPLAIDAGRDVKVIGELHPQEELDREAWGNKGPNSGGPQAMSNWNYGTPTSRAKSYAEWVTGLQWDISSPTVASFLNVLPKSSGTELSYGGLPRDYNTSNNIYRKYPRRAYINSYWWDLHDSMMRTIMVANKAWNKRTPTEESNYGAVDDTYVADDSSYIKRFSTGTISQSDPAVMRLNFELEFLRIIGESLPTGGYTINDGVLGSAVTGNVVTTGFGRTRGTRDFGGTPKWRYTFTKYPSQLQPTANVRAMEYLLNDYRMSLLGSEALDFNGDGYAESTTNGWKLGGQTVWSWWWDGVHEVNDEATNGWLTVPTWYRFYDGDANIYRLEGANWRALNGAERTKLLAVNGAFLRTTWNGTPGSVEDQWNGLTVSGIVSNGPIKNWSATGRFFIGPSKCFNYILKTQLLNLDTNIKAFEISTHGVVDIDANRDVDEKGNGSLSDIQYLYKRNYMTYFPKAYE